LDIGVLGFFGIVSHKEHPPEVWSLPPVTPCILRYCPCLKTLEYRTIVRKAVTNAV